MYYIDEDNDKLKGSRIKITSLHSASGMLSPALMTISGLDESGFTLPDEKFDKREGIFVVQMQGLTIIGGTNPMGGGNGHVVFVRSTKYDNY